MTNDHHFPGVRFSRYSTHKAGIIDATSKGKVDLLKVFEHLDIADGWHEATLRFSDGLLPVELDGAKISQTQLPLPANGQVGFRAGSRKTVIDDVFIRDQSGLEYRESFANKKNYSRLLALNFFLVFSVIILITFILIILSRQSQFEKYLINSLVLTSGLLSSFAICFCLISCTDQNCR